MVHLKEIDNCKTFFSNLYSADLTIRPHCMGYLYGIGMGAGATAIQTPGAPFTPMSNPIPTPYIGPQPIAPYPNRTNVGFGER